MGDAGIRWGSGLGGAGLGALLGTFVFPGVGTALGAGLGGALGSGVSSAATGASTEGSLLNALLGAGIGYGVGHFGAPLLAGEAAKDAGTAVSLQQLAQGPPAFQIGTTTVSGSEVPRSMVMTDPSVMQALGEGGRETAKGAAESIGLLNQDTLQKALFGTMLAGQLGFLLNPQPRPLSQHGLSGVPWSFSPGGAQQAYNQLIAQQMQPSPMMFRI